MIETQTPEQIRKRREAFLYAVVWTVERSGYCELAPYGLENLDDPGAWDTFRGALEMIAAHTRGERWEEPETWLSALRKTCRERGWEIRDQFPSPSIWVVAPVKKWTCPCCGGRGRLHEPLGAYDPDAVLDLGSLTERLCSQCNRTGYVESRIEPEVCWLPKSI